MRLPSILILSYLSVLFYFIVLNASFVYWFPLPLVVLVLLAMSIDSAHLYYIAFFIGFFIDIHFLYFGPFIIIMVMILYSIRYLQKKIVTPRVFIATAIIILLTVVEYFCLQVLMFSALNGWVQYTISLSVVSFIIAASLTTGMIGIALHSLIRSVVHLRRRYE